MKSNGWDEMGWPELLFCIAAIVVVAAVAAIISSEVRTFLWQETTAAWASAVATGIAVIFALWESGSERRRVRANERDRAAVYAVHMLAKLDQYVWRLQSASRLAYFDDLLDGMDNFRGFAGDLASAVTDVTLDHLVELIPLNDRAAHRLVRGMALVEEIRAGVAHDLKRLDAHPSWTVSNGETLSYARRLDEATDLIILGSRACKAMTLEYVKPVTAEEIYGD